MLVFQYFCRLFTAIITVLHVRTITYNDNPQNLLAVQYSTIFVSADN